MIKIDEFRLIGLALKSKTTNENGQSAIDCGNLWTQFMTGNYPEAIPGRISTDIYAVYHSYEKDYTKPFSYFIGCKVNPDTKLPDGMDSLDIPDGNYEMFTAKGEMPDCVGKAWNEIWNSDTNRAYGSDFEVYSEKSKAWNNAEVDIFISVK